MWSSAGGGVVDNGLRILGLTPLECWRLMGIDDEDFYKAQSVVSIHNCINNNNSMWLMY